MIATWMLSAVLFTLLLGVAALCAEWALRAAALQARWTWLAALGASIMWPVLAPWLRRALPASGSVHTFAASMPTIYVVPDRLPAAVTWMQQLDVVILTLWAVATMIMVVRITRALVLLARVRQNASPRVVDGVSVLMSASVGPAVIGVLSPSVLFPESLLELDASHRRLVLEHEQQHCQARDPWFVLASAIAVALVPWNVPLWWMVRRARLALEIDCDARVLASATDVNGYGKLLLLISQRQTTMTLSPMLAASPSHLERRIIAMREAQLPRRSLRVAVGLAGAVMVAGAACASRIGDRVAGPTVSGIAPSKGTLPVNKDQPYFEFQVEQQVQQIPGTGNLRYPDSLRKANVEGEVLAQFVVDENGIYEKGSFKELKSTNALFTSAVKNALPNMRFAPARVGGQAVKQLVQQPFTFSLSKGDNPSLAQPAPGKSGTLVDLKSEKPAKQIPGTGNIRYPDSLRAANVMGEVVAQFVVNADGRIEPGTFKVLKSSHPLFTEAVRNALPDMRFESAVVNGRAVRQLMQLPYTFSLSSPSVQEEKNSKESPVTRQELDVAAR